MPIIRTQVRLPFFTNMPGDEITNTFYFDSSIVGDLSDIADDLQPLILAFYNGCYATTGMAGYVSLNNCSVRYYDMTDPEPRQPEIRPMNLSALNGSTTVVPTEVACVLSFHGAPQSGIPVARQRGRIYLGALDDLAITASGSSGSFPTISTAFRDAVTESAEDLRENTSAANAPWVVFSRAATNVFEVVGGWVDNSPDTQRRRSVDSTTRTLWPD